MSIASWPISLEPGMAPMLVVAAVDVALLVGSGSALR